MTLKPELAHAILSMDSYNRGYNAGISTLPSNINVKLGNATIKTTSTIALGNGLDSAIGFYAIAYDTNGDNVADVISYRGTDYPKDINQRFRDPTNGWTLGAGSLSSPQGEMAVKFYQAVAGAGKWFNSNITLTGHSMGGGLAGFVGELYEKNAYIYDSMTYDLAAARATNYVVTYKDSGNFQRTVTVSPDAFSHFSTYYPGSKILSWKFENPAYVNMVYGGNTPIDPDHNGIKGFYVAGEALQNMTRYNDADYSNPNSRLNVLNGVNLIPNPGNENGIVDSINESVARHSQATLAILMFKDEMPALTQWQAAVPYFWPVLYNHDFARDMGMTDARVAGELQAQQQYSDILRTIIAYSAIDEGTRVFGDTAIRALYNDANDLGKALSAPGASKGLAGYADEISKAFVQFAGQAALNKAEAAKVPAALNGVLTLSEAVNNRTLTVSFDDTLWKMGTNTLPKMVGREEILNDALKYYEGRAYLTGTGYAGFLGHPYAGVLAMRDLWGNGTATAFGKAVIAAMDSGTTILSPAAGDKAGVFVGGGGADVVTGSAGRDYIYGSAGDDTIIASGGADIIRGGVGTDTFDMRRFANGVELDFSQESYASLSNPNVDKGRFDGDEWTPDVERFLLGDGNDKIRIFSNSLPEEEAYRFIDAGGGRDELTSLYGETLISNGSIFSGAKEIRNVEVLGQLGGGRGPGGGYYTGSDEIAILSLGQEYRGLSSWFNYSGYARALTINTVAGTVTDGVATDRGAVGYLVGTDKGDRITMTDFDNIWSGRGNDTIALQSLYPGIYDPRGYGGQIVYSGGNDVINVQSNYRSVARITMAPGINTSDVSITEKNKILAYSSEVGRYYQFDLVVSIKGYGSITVPKSGISISYGYDRQFNTSDDTISFSVPDIRFWDGHFYAATANGTSLVMSIRNPDGFHSPYVGTATPYNDVLTGTEVVGGSGNDSIVASLSAYGGTGDDTITANKGYGGLGNDTLRGYASGDLLYGEFGDDTLYGEAGDDLLDGGPGVDKLQGGIGNDEMYGDEGNDAITGGAGNDSIDGGNGIDTAVFNSAYAISTITIANILINALYVSSSDGFDRLLGVERLQFTDGVYENGVFTRSAMYGTPGNDILNGTAGADTIYGQAGNDTINGGPGNDALYGDAGIDTLTYAGATAGVTLNLGVSSAQNTGGAGTDTVAGFENLTGSTFNDVLTGDDKANSIEGGSGNDIIDGGRGPENDILSGGAGIDTVSYASSVTAAVTVSLANTGMQNTGGAGRDTLSGFENLTGTPLNDTLTGDAGANVINGGRGHDFIQGGGGNDTLVGDAGIDTAVYSAAASGVTVNLSLMAAQNTIGAGIDTLGGFENLTGSAFNDVLTGDAAANNLSGGGGSDSLYAGGGDDSLIGGAGNDMLYGEAGNDVIYADEGANTLYGGIGADTFRFLGPVTNGNVDTVKDFKRADGDRLDIANIISGFNPATKAITDFIEITNSGNNSIVKIDTDGKGTAVTWAHVATIEGVTGLTDELALLKVGALVAQ